MEQETEIPTTVVRNAIDIERVEDMVGDNYLEEANQLANERLREELQKDGNEGEEEGDEEGEDEIDAEEAEEDEEEEKKQIIERIMELLTINPYMKIPESQAEILEKLKKEELTGLRSIMIQLQNSAAKLVGEKFSSAIMKFLCYRIPHPRINPEELYDDMLKDEPLRHAFDIEVALKFSWLPNWAKLILLVVVHIVKHLADKTYGKRKREEEETLTNIGEPRESTEQQAAKRIRYTFESETQGG
mgnify:CR=1 FL=1